MKTAGYYIRMKKAANNLPTGVFCDLCNIEEGFALYALGGCDPHIREVPAEDRLTFALECLNNAKLTTDSEAFPHAVTHNGKRGRINVTFNGIPCISIYFQII